METINIILKPLKIGNFQGVKEAEFLEQLHKIENVKVQTHIFSTLPHGIYYHKKFKEITLSKGGESKTILNLKVNII